MKKGLTILTLLTLSLGIAIPFSFNDAFKVEAKANATTDMSNIALLSGESFDTSHIIYDDFSSSTLNDNWVVSHRKWGGNGNKGVSADNVYLDTTNHKVIIKALGNQHVSTETKNGIGGPISGGALVLKETVRPGRYETRFKSAYKVGVCNALWTYTENSSGQNHEIDIEFPVKDSKGNNAFNEVIFTNWIGETNYDQKHKTLNYYLNDGEYHTFAFDWYYSKNHKVINYYIDAKLLATNTVSSKLPFLPTRLWLGCWIPNNAGFVGLPDFDECFMEIDYFKYSPFLNQEDVTKGNAGGCGETSLNYHIIDKAFDKYDWISNGEFNAIDKTTSLEERGYEVNGTARIYTSYDRSGNLSSGGLKISPESSATYKIDSTYKNYKYILSTYYKGQGDIKIAFYNKSKSVIKTLSLILPNRNDWNYLSYPFLVPDNTFYTVIEAKTSVNDLYIDDLSMVFGTDEPVEEVILLDLALTKPSKATYYIGESLNLSGLSLTGTYSDGTQKEIKEYNVSPVDLSTVGLKEVVITVKNMSVSFYINVDDRGESTATLSFISVEGNFKKDYFVGDELDFTGMVVKASYSDGTQKEITNYQISMPDTSTSGIKRVTIIYVDQMVYFEVTIKQKSGICGGNVVAASLFLTLISFVGIILLTYKKKSSN